MAIAQKSILIVDDDKINRSLLSQVFEEDYLLTEACDGRQAVELIEANLHGFDIMLLDIAMPEMDGFGVMEYLNKAGILEHLPVIFITAESTTPNIHRAYELGATDMLTKPFMPYVVRRRVENVLAVYAKKEHLEQTVAKQTAALRNQSLLLADAMSSIIEFKNQDSGQHILRIRILTQFLLNALKKDGYPVNLSAEEIQLISEAAVMHDIGKITTPDAILNKPGKLTPEEFEVIKQHTVAGCDVAKKLRFVRSSEYLAYVIDICRHHHERWDGGGYPDGLRGNKITIWSQVVSLTDVYDALTNERVYKKAFPHEKALAMIAGRECGVFNPALLRCFLKHADEMVQYLDENTQLGAATTYN